jgi:hypothetical protein
MSSNPIPTGTQYTILLPWVGDRVSKETLFQMFNALEWGHILQLDMLYKKPVQNSHGKPKPAHFKVFIHFGALNPIHNLIFEHLDYFDAELKIYYSNTNFWKVRKSTWEQLPPIPTQPVVIPQIRVELVTKPPTNPWVVVTKPETNPWGVVTKPEKNPWGCLHVE